MKESDVRKKLADEWRKHGAHVCPIENEVGTGIPDLNVAYRGVEFWTELKFKENCPVRKNTPAIRGMLRPDQRVWMKKRVQTGAKNVFLFIRIDNELFLTPVRTEVEVDDFETISVDELYERSIWYGIVRQCPNYHQALETMRASVLKVTS